MDNWIVFFKKHFLWAPTSNWHNQSPDSRNMNDLHQQNYMVRLVKWVKKNYEAETLSEIKKANVPKAKDNTRGPVNFLS